MTPQRINCWITQGSILGNFPFCITTDWLKRDIDYTSATRDQGGRLPNPPAIMEAPLNPEADQAPIGEERQDHWRRGIHRAQNESDHIAPLAPRNYLCHLSKEHRPTSRQRSVGIPCGTGGNMSTPTTRGQFARFRPDTDLEEDKEPSFRFFRPRPRRIFDNSAINPVRQEELDDDYDNNPIKQMDREILLIKYIDDFNVINKIYKKNAIMTYSQNQTETSVRAAIKSEILYNNVREMAIRLEMGVNSWKDQMLRVCPHTTMSTATNTFRRVDDGKVLTTGKKTLEFYFGRKPKVDQHFWVMEKKLQPALDCEARPPKH